MLPQLTTDLDQARADLDRIGFCRIEGALAPDELARLRQRTVEQAAAEVEAGVAFLDTGGANQRMWNLLNKGQEFQDLIVRPLALEMMRHLLGDRFLLSSLTANIAGPGGTPMVLHQDEGFVPFPQPAYPLVANIAWLLDDVTDANGGTRFVPGSHLWDEPLAHLTDPPTTTVAAEGPAGTAVVFDGRIWHGTGANRADAKRHVLLAYYCRPFIRQQENPFLSMSPDVEADLSPEVRRLLGYKIWRTLGGVEGQIVNGPDGFVRRPEAPIGRLPEPIVGAAAHSDP